MCTALVGDVVGGERNVRPNVRRGGELPEEGREPPGDGQVLNPWCRSPEPRHQVVPTPLSSTGPPGRGGHPDVAEGPGLKVDAEGVLGPRVLGQNVDDAAYRDAAVRGGVRPFTTSI